MPVIDEVSLALVESHFSKSLKKPVQADILIGTSHKCAVLEEICNRISERSNGKIKFRKVRSDDAPGVRILPNFTYLGLPTGTMAGTFVHMLADASSGELFTPKPLQKEIAALKGKIEVVSVIAVSNIESAGQARWVYELARLCPKINATVIDGVTFPEVPIRLGVRFTPTTIINKKVRVIGMAGPEELLAKIRLALQE
ncbi:MAG: hypothetical protein N3H30_02135 [Candidatus Micrarchaeota archaeon]|nr:hypothetical protein [Candidatus Micrarchaeota archaeon]